MGQYRDMRGRSKAAQRVGGNMSPSAGVGVGRSLGAALWQYVAGVLSPTITPDDRIESQSPSVFAETTTFDSIEAGAHIEGADHTLGALDTGAHVEGDAQAVNDLSTGAHVEGELHSSNDPLEHGAHLEGHEHGLSGGQTNGAHIEGDECTVAGMDHGAHVEGSSHSLVETLDFGAHVEGYSHTVSVPLANGTHVEGHSAQVVATGEHVQGYGGTTGQYRRVGLLSSTFNDTPRDMDTLNANGEVYLRDNALAVLRITIGARMSDDGSIASAWTLDAVAERDGGTTRIVGTPIPTVIAQDAGAAVWGVSIVDSANGVTVTVTGDVDTSINWCGTAEITEVW